MALDTVDVRACVWTEDIEAKQIGIYFKPWSRPIQIFDNIEQVTRKELDDETKTNENFSLESAWIIMIFYLFLFSTGNLTNTTMTAKRTSMTHDRMPSSIWIFNMKHNELPKHNYVGHQRKLRLEKRF